MNKKNWWDIFYIYFIYIWEILGFEVGRCTYTELITHIKWLLYYATQRGKSFNKHFHTKSMRDLFVLFASRYKISFNPTGLGLFWRWAWFTLMPHLMCLKWWWGTEARVILHSGHGPQHKCYCSSMCCQLWILSCAIKDNLELFTTLIHNFELNLRITQA